MALTTLNLDGAFSTDLYDTLPDPSAFTGQGMRMRILGPGPKYTVLGIVARPIAASVLEELHGDGAGSFQIAYSDIAEQPALYNYGNIVQVMIDGVVRAAWVIRQKHRVLISNGEEGARYYEISGPGLRDAFNAAVVYPENPKAISLAKLKSHSRYFNFGSAIEGDWYKSSQWHAPAYAMTQLRVDAWDHGDTGNPWRFAPAAIPDTTSHRNAKGQLDYPDGAKWIWTVDPTPTAPKGTSYFRYKFTTKTVGTYTLYATGDNTIQGFVDGVPMINQHNGPTTFTTADNGARIGDHDTWRHIWSAQIDLNPGNHVVALKTTNYDNTSPAATLGILYREGNGRKNTASEIVTMTGMPGWKCLSYPSTAPGWSPGEVLIQLFAEAQKRKVHALAGLKPTFSRSKDSNGDPWQFHLDYSFDIGTTYYDVVNTLEGLSCDVWINPANMTLNVYNNQGVDRTVQTTTKQPIIFARALNAIESNEDSTGSIVNTALVGWGNEQLKEIVDPFNTISKYGRRESYQSVDANLDESATDGIVHYQLESQHLPVDSVTLTMTDMELNTPWVDFKLGDMVLAPHTGGGYKPRRVMSITATLDSSTGQPNYELELDSTSQTRQDAIARYMQRHVGVDLAGTELQGGGVSSGSLDGGSGGGSNTSSSGDGSTLGTLVESSTGAALVIIQNTPPTGVPIGSLWFDTGSN